MNNLARGSAVRSTFSREEIILRIAFRHAVLTLFVAAGATPSTASDGPPAVLDAAALHLALEKLSVVGSVLYVAAHPDDENTRAARLARERAARCAPAYLSMTRGDGGQNLIGAEQGELLGVIRTQELLAARRIDGAEQFFTRARGLRLLEEPDETLAHLGHATRCSRDVVRVIRTLPARRDRHALPDRRRAAATATTPPRRSSPRRRSRRPPTRRASPSSSRDARAVAGEAAPLEPLSAGPRRPAARCAEQLISIDVGGYDPLLGRSYSEIAGESRSMHKSQGFGVARAPRLVSRISSSSSPGRAGDRRPVRRRRPRLDRVRGGGAVGKLLAMLLDRAYDPATPAASRAGAARGRAPRWRDVALRRRPAMRRSSRDKARELDDVIARVRGLWLEAVGRVSTRSPRRRFDARSMLTASTARAPARRADAESDRIPRRRDSPADSRSAENRAGRPALRSIVPASRTGAPRSRTGCASRRGAGCTRSRTARSSDTPGAIPALRVDGLASTVSAASRRLDAAGRVPLDRPVRGERYRPLCIVPPVTLALDTQRLPVPRRRRASGAPQARIALAAPRAGPALALPPGWRGERRRARGRALRRGARPATSLPGHAAAERRAALARRVRRPTAARFTRDMTVIDYPHIPIADRVPPGHCARRAAAALHKRATRRLLMGPGDDVPAALAQVGYGVTLLDGRRRSRRATSRATTRSSPASAPTTRARGAQAQCASGCSTTSSGRHAGRAVQHGRSNRCIGTARPLPVRDRRDRVTDEEAPSIFTDPASTRCCTTPNPIDRARLRRLGAGARPLLREQVGPEYRDRALRRTIPARSRRRAASSGARHGKGRSSTPGSPSSASSRPACPAPTACSSTWCRAGADERARERPTGPDGEDEPPPIASELARPLRRRPRRARRSLIARSSTRSRRRSRERARLGRAGRLRSLLHRRLRRVEGARRTATRQLPPRGDRSMRWPTIALHHHGHAGQRHHVPLDAGPGLRGRHALRAVLLRPAARDGRAVRSPRCRSTTGSRSSPRTSTSSTASTSKCAALAAVLFLVQRGLAAGITIYAPAIILSRAPGLEPPRRPTCVIGVLVIIYTVAGGTQGGQPHADVCR